VATPVAEVNEEIRCLAADMAETMYAAPGIGSAATQVNVRKTVFCGGYFRGAEQLEVFINPEIIASEGKTGA